MTVSPRILALGGLDPGGGAGLTAYARMAQARGALVLPSATCLTVQNRYGVQGVHPVSSAVCDSATRAAIDDGPVDAVVVGLLGEADIARAVAELVRPLRAGGVPVVVDPVLSATAGGWQGAAELAAAYRECWLPMTSVLTPNLDELDQLAAGAGVTGLLGQGCEAVLVTGGHGEGETVEDRLCSAGGEVVFAHRRRAVGAVHGTGCALAAAIACELGAGRGIEAACRDAIAVVGRCLDATRTAPDGRPVPLVVV